jgi:DNA-binding NarL/FixJ family response regulator
MPAPRVVNVRVQRHPEWRFEVQDNGIGFDAGRTLAPDSLHVGLRILRERAEGISARVEVQSHSRRGHHGVHRAATQGIRGVGHRAAGRIACAATAFVEFAMSPASAITVFVVDDHNLFRRGLVALLSQDEGLHVVGEAGDAAEALRLVPVLQPQVILLDNHLPGVLGVDAVRGLRAASPASHVLMLTVSEDAQDLAAALRNGAQGYLLKTIDGDLLAEAIRRAAAGEPVVSPELMGKLVAAFQSQGGPAPIAPPMETGASAFHGRPGGCGAFPLAARRGGAARDCPGCEQQGNCPHAGYC